LETGTLSLQEIHDKIEERLKQRLSDNIRIGVLNLMSEIEAAVLSGNAANRLQYFIRECISLGIQI
jgi:hypothetical protein